MKRLRQWTFRDTWEHFCFLTLNDHLRTAAEEAGMDLEGANGMLTWCYVNKDGALSYALLAPAAGYRSGSSEPLAPPATVRRCVDRWQVVDCGAFVYPRESYRAYVAAVVAFCWTLHTDEALTCTRRLRKLDAYRNRTYPDEVPVLLVYHLRQCQCPACCRRLEGNSIYAELAADPDIEMGLHEGDEVSFLMGTAYASVDSELSFVVIVTEEMVRKSRSRQALLARFNA